MSKSKFQISRALDNKIESIVSDIDNYETEFAEFHQALILGFHCGNVSNYVGLTRDYEKFNAGMLVNGLVFFKKKPADDEVASNLELVRNFYHSLNGIGNFSEDKNRDLYLIYFPDSETNRVIKKIYDFGSKSFVDEQPKLSVLDDAKVYNHSAITKLNLSIRFDTCSESDKLNNNKFAEQRETITKHFINGTEGIKFHLKNSNFSIDFKQGNKNITETLYDNLDPPSDIEQMGDYLPQMSKEEKKKLVDKWRNKVKSQRGPLEIDIEHENLSFNSEDSLTQNCCILKFDVYFHLHMNDSISKSLKLILFLVRQHIDSLFVVVQDKSDINLESDELKSCTFKPRNVSHFTTALYPLSFNKTPDYKYLKQLRQQFHEAYLIPLKNPQFRYSQRVLNVDLKTSDERKYLCNVHKELSDSSGIKGGLRSILNGTYTYHHYMQDRIDDNGWGCAYRSLQTIISWFKHQGYIYSPDVEIRIPKSSQTEDKTALLRKKLHEESRVPTHEEIQSVLVDVGVQTPSFIGSKKWIGSHEISNVLDQLYNIPCRFITVSSGSQMSQYARDIHHHFTQDSTPVMIGGGVLAHTIIGVDINEKNFDISFLVLDPHYTGGEDLVTIQKKGWCGWKKASFWDKTAFYNLCLPQMPDKEI